MLRRAAETLRGCKSDIASAVEARIYADLKSYNQGALPADESHGTVVNMIDFVVENLSSDGRRFLDKALLTDVISFEEGIAARRVRYRISMIDLLHGVQILRDEIWKALREEFASNGNGDFFVLERRINALLDHFLVGISDAYLKSQEDITAHHIAALEKWEEVVKSASSIELKIPCCSEYVAIARLQAEAIARRVGYTEEQIHDVVYAVGEAADNAIEHGISARGVDLHYTLTAEELRVEISDFGGGFDPAGRGEAPPDLFEEHGRGIFMMKALMDDVRITSSNLGTRVELAKRRPAESELEEAAHPAADEALR